MTGLIVTAWLPAAAAAEDCSIAAGPALSARQCEAAAAEQLAAHLSAAERRRTARALCQESVALALDPLVVLALIDAESTANPRAVSSRGAQGLMQLMPVTGEDWARREHIVLPAAGLLDPTANVRLGMRYLAALRQEFGRLDLALLAYNLGAASARSRLRSRGQDLDVCANALVAHVVLHCRMLRQRYAQP